MTKEEFCANCGGDDCCYIYNRYIGNEDKIRLIKEKLFRNKDQFGIEPLPQVGEKCEYLGENGCIIKRENRPIQCLKYECDKLKRHG